MYLPGGESCSAVLLCLLRAYFGEPVHRDAIPDHCCLQLSSCFRQDVSCCVAASFLGIQERPPLSPSAAAAPVTPITCALHPTSLAVRRFTESLGPCLGQSFPKAAGLSPAADRSLCSAIQQRGRSCSLPRGFSGVLRYSSPRNGTLTAGTGRTQPGALRLAPANTFRKYGFLTGSRGRTSRSVCLELK